MFWKERWSFAFAAGKDFTKIISREKQDISSFQRIKKTYNNEELIK